MIYKISIVNHNRYSDTLECLESILKSTEQNFQLFVVDNSTREKDYEMFKKWSLNVPLNLNTKFPDLVYPISHKNNNDILFINEEEIEIKKVIEQKIVFIKAKENKGFSAANNIVLKFLKKQDKYDYIWILNNDTVIPTDFLRNISIKMSKEKNNVGLVGNSLCYYDFPKKLQCVGNKFNPWLAHTFPLYENKQFSDISKSDINNLIPIGASMFIKKECFNDVGFLDEDYFLYFEEWDYASRAKKRKWKSLIITKFHIYHKHGTTINCGKDGKQRKTLFADYYFLKNKILFAKKNLKFYNLPIIYLSFIPIIINRIKHRQWDRLALILKIMLR